MNKYIIILIVIVFLIGGGFGYRTFFSSEENRPIKTGIIRIVPMTSSELRWEFIPEFLEVNQGDHIVLTIVNEDKFDHGFAIDAYGISQRMPAKGIIQIEFDATKAGDFPFYCSVSCGSGIVDGKKRGHFDQIGKMHVRSLISETTTFKDTISDEELRKETRRASMIQEANRKFSELYDIPFADSENEIQIDNENIEWLKTGEVRESLENISYQALYVDFKEKSDVSSRSWVFINTETGEVVDTII